MNYFADLAAFVQKYYIDPIIYDTSYNPATLKPLRTPMVRLPGTPLGTAISTLNVQKTRQLTLNEVMGMPVTTIDPVTGVLTAYPGGPLEILVNNTKWGGERVTGVGVLGMYTMEQIPDFTLDGYGKNWVSEISTEGETEIWEIVNLTADAHPIHLHLVQFQLMNRQTFDAKAYGAAYAAAFLGGGYDPMTGAPYPPGVFIPGFGPPCDYKTGDYLSPKRGSCITRPRLLGGNPDVAATGGKNGKPLYLKGTPQPPAPYEAGWKDTVIMYPGEVTRIAVRWAPTDIPVGGTGSDLATLHFPFDPNSGHGYVWHCHIIDHEDNEMMRPNLVVPLDGATRTYIKGDHY